MVSEILGHFLFSGDRNDVGRSWSIYHSMRLYTRNKNIYGLGMGILLVYEILGHFLFSRNRNHVERSWPIYHSMRLFTRNKNIYGLGVGISTVFEIFAFSNSLGVGMTPGARSNWPYILSIPLNICYWRLHINICNRFQVITIENIFYNFPHRNQC